MMRIDAIGAGLLLSSLLLACGPAAPEATGAEATSADTLRYPAEQHLRNIRQLTFGGDNAEAYFSFDNRLLSFQATNPEWGTECDQIYYMPTDGFTGRQPSRISSGEGRTTCAFFLPGNEAILYAGTHAEDPACPETPRVVDGKYVWPVYASFDIYVADLRGNITRRLTDHPGYDAEATVSPDGQMIVFTSDRSGDLELWTMNIDGSDLRQVTDGLGYDGGAFFSPDGRRLVFRASRPRTEEDVATYRGLLNEGLVQPTNMELFICNVDGSDLRQITDLGKANWAPYFHRDGRRILFASNHHIPSGRQFNIFMINVDGTGLEQVTFDDTFDSFPMFSYDGKQVVFSSNRNNGGTRSTNVFIADWVE